MNVLRAATFAALLCALTPALARDEAHRNADAADELRDMCRRDAGRLWGADLCGPLIIVDPETRAVWASQADGEGVLHRQRDGWIGTLPAGVGVANTSTEWAGVRWIMVVGPLPRDETERRVLLAHESWHRIQTQIGLAAQGSDCIHLETEQGRTLLRLEMRALAQAMRSENDARWNAVRDALAFRAARLAAFPNASAQEAALDRNEGLASYTGAKLGAGIDAAAFAAKTLDDYDRHSAYARAYAYATGPAYGLLLDRQDRDWRTHLGQAAPADLLAHLMRFEPPSAADLSLASFRYGSSIIAAQESGRAGEQRTRIASLRGRYGDGARLVLPLGQMHMDFDPNRVTPINGLGNAYQTLTVRDAWGELRATDGALISTDFSQLIAPAPNGDGLSGPGWTLTLAPGYRLVGPNARGVRSVEAIPAAQ
jgi:hypothetical protein